MREYKFRAWEKNTNSMVLFSLGENNIGYIAKDGEFYHFDIFDSLDCIMQYIGLKDKNGKEIYEGDILETTYQAWNRDRPPTYSIEKHKLIVRYEESECDGFPFIGYYFNTHPNYWEVIGNIYENPELLNEKT